MADDDDKPVLSLVEETVTIGKRNTVTGRVRVQTVTETINETVPVNLQSVDVDVVRIPVDRVIDTIPEIRGEGDVTIIPVVEERIVMTCALLLREEIHFRQTAYRETHDIPVSVRKPRTQIDHVDAQNGNSQDMHDFRKGVPEDL
ncbi:YsnF/AvaK domain-containing protein [Paracoccus marcusii]|uniref:YsnF/AvaK domain-containing protein n=1 Tax=Paracoccus marcusii TaxID=59779 RepID=UPI0024913D4F|nr:YsnF/AvaK domain-containing protein [Paracoccus marcusii]